MSHQMVETFEVPAVWLVSDRGSSTQQSPAASDVESHAVFAALDQATRQRLLDAGREQVLEVGDSLGFGYGVAFVLEGVLGTFCAPMDVCVAIAGSGSVLGLDDAFDAPTSYPAETLVRGRVFVAPLEALIQALGRSRVMELCLRHTRARLSDMEREAACNATHLVSQRLAKWLLRLHRANRTRDLILTQADLARLMGVQRTSVNTAARQLQILGAARFTRGRVVIRDADLLSQSACRCAA